MNRREFIAGSSLAAAALMSGFSSALAQERRFRGPRKPLSKAISLGMVGAGSNILDKFKIAKDIGFDGLEVNAPCDDETLKQLVAARDETGVRIAGIMFAGNWSQNLGDLDAEKRKVAAESVTKALQQAKELGAPHILVVPGVVNAATPYQDVWRNSLVELQKLAPIAEENRVKIGIENVWNNFILSPVEAAYYVDQINSPWVGWFMDLGNIVNIGWPEQWVRTLNRRLVNLHIKEFSRKLADSKGKWAGFGVELLEGDNNWPEVMKAVKEVNFRGWIIAEVGGGDEKRLAFLAEAMDKIIAMANYETPQQRQ